MKKIKGWRRLVAVGAALALLVGMIVPTSVTLANPGNEVSIALPYSSVDEDAVFTIPVAIDNITNFDACQYDVVVNGEEGLLTLTDVTAGSIGGTEVPVIGFNKMPEDTYTDKDAWRVAQNISGTDGATGAGTFATLEFTVGAGKDGKTCTITLEGGLVSDTTANPIECNWTGTGTLTIDKLEFSAITVVGETDWSRIVTNEGYKDPATANGCATVTSFDISVDVSGGTGVYTYAWEFGNETAGTTTDANPTDVTYGAKSAGETISVVVTDQLGSTTDGTDGGTDFTALNTGMAVVHDTLLTGFSGDTGTAGHALEGIVKSNGVDAWVTTTKGSSTVTFTDSTAGGDEVYTYSWDFNNDSVEDSTGQNPANIDFAAYCTSLEGASFDGAEFTVVLTAKDDLAATDDESKTDYVKMYAVGDIQGNLTLDAADVTEIGLIIALTNPETWTSDANDDGFVNILDVTKTELLYAAYLASTW